MIEGDKNESYYLCEGLWLNTDTKTLINEYNKQTLDINNIDDKIYILEQEVRQWIFHPMLKLVEDDKINKSKYRPFKNAIFILYGIFSYIEKIQRYKDGKPYKSRDTESTKILTFGFKNIFKTTQDEQFGNTKIESILENTRHSMMHSGIIGDKVLLNYEYENSVPISYIGSNKELNKIELNPIFMLSEIINHFNNYINEIKNTSNINLRENFKTVFNTVYNDEIDVLS